MHRNSPEKTEDALDVGFMRRALAEAKKAEAKGEVPVGAVIVRNGKIIGRGGNSPIRLHDATAHAEIIALRQACRRTGNYRLADCDLYVTIEPCCMCLGAMIHARIRRLVYGARDPKTGAVESAMVFPQEKTHHRLTVRKNVLSEECGGILRDFFRKKRKKSRTML